MFDVRLFGYTCPYSCRTCWFNQANPSRVKVSLSEAATAKLSHYTGTTQPLCSRRGVELFSPSGMICEIYALQPEEVEESAVFSDLGPVYTLVGDLGSGDRAVPLEDGSKLQRGDTTGCSVCGLRSYGLNILAKDDSRYDFCSAAHYLEWWKARNVMTYNFFTKHDTPSLETEGQPRVILLEHEPAHEVIKRNSSVHQRLWNLLLRAAYVVLRSRPRPTSTSSTNRQRPNRVKTLNDLKHINNKLNVDFNYAFKKLHHFNSSAFTSKPSGFNDFVEYCVSQLGGIKAGGENEQTIQRACRYLELILAGSRATDAMNIAWQDFPVLRKPNSSE